MFSWGKGGFGRLGHGDTVSVEQPKQVMKLSSVHIQQVACGFAYTAAVCSKGNLYTWGAGENGRLGVGGTENQVYPQRVTALAGHRVTQVFAGSVHTTALTDAGEIYSCGKHEYTGHGSNVDILYPTLLDAFKGKVSKYERRTSRCVATFFCLLL